MPKASLLECVDKFEIALKQREYGHVGFRTRSQSSKTLREGEEIGGIGRRPFNHLFQSQSQMEELRQSRRQVKDRPVNVELVHVAGDRSRDDILFESFFSCVKREAAGAMPDVQVDASGHGAAHFR